MCKDQSKYIIATYLLNRTLKDRENGTFLLRKQDNDYVLSFHFGQMVYHVNVKEPGNGRTPLEMGGVFVNLVTFVEMVDYFRKVPIFKTVRLTSQKHVKNSAKIDIINNTSNEEIDTLKE